ncbi:hypothetical protein XENOCAPTIV_012171 [Xenoophorus captivus]|uniref:Uncharacterized protein n=1 Tax=Xenoophorus captivus TaxID=1517983 RepID=A0ABV0S6S1_9TELE
MTFSKHVRKSLLVLRHQTGTEHSFYQEGRMSAKFFTFLAGAELGMTEDRMKACSQYHLVAMCGIEHRALWWLGGGDARHMQSRHRPSGAELPGPLSAACSFNIRLVLLLSSGCVIFFCRKIYFLEAVGKTHLDANSIPGSYAVLCLLVSDCSAQADLTKGD